MSAIPEWLKREAWKAVVAPITSAPWNRSPELLAAVTDQFMVDVAPRYQPVTDPKTKKRLTFCNIFGWDWSTAMGVEIPHWVTLPDGRRVELDANGTFDWLSTIGVKEHGWEKIPELVAREHAALGKPAVGVWKNPFGPGHIAPLREQRPGLPKQTYSTQAGGVNYTYGLLRLGFGDKPITFFRRP